MASAPTDTKHSNYADSYTAPHTVIVFGVGFAASKLISERQSLATGVCAGSIVIGEAIFRKLLSYVFKQYDTLSFSGKSTISTLLSAVMISAAVIARKVLSPSLCILSAATAGFFSAIAVYHANSLEADDAKRNHVKTLFVKFITKFIGSMNDAQPNTYQAHCWELMNAVGPGDENRNARLLLISKLSKIGNDELFLGTILDEMAETLRRHIGLRINLDKSMDDRLKEAILMTIIPYKNEVDRRFAFRELIEMGRKQLVYVDEDKDFTFGNSISAIQRAVNPDSVTQLFAELKQRFQSH